MPSAETLKTSKSHENKTDALTLKESSHFVMLSFKHKM
ncbi:hypothetical protein CSC18_1272 [Klebsiella aerogenes]|nr:hypothetical protein CSC18_1272 [Klebsiella aerogenes]